MKPELRCSSLDRVIECPGSRTLSRIVLDGAIDIGEVGGSQATWQGSWCHWEAARRLIEEHGAVGPVGGLQPPDIPEGWEPSKFDRYAVDWFIATLLALTPEDHAIYVEHGFRWETDEFILTGHIDVFTVSPLGDVVHWNDQKRGMDEVEPAEFNYQVAGYGALLAVNLPSVKTGEARILQRSAERPVSEVVVDDMQRMPTFIRAKIVNALANPNQLNTGKHCNYCPGLLVGDARGAACPAVRAHINHMKMLLTEEHIATLKAAPDLKPLALLAYDCSRLQRPMKTVIDSLRERMAVGGQVDLGNGLVATVVEENGRRTTRHPQAVFDYFKGRVDEDRLWQCFKPTWGENGIEDALVETGLKRTSKKEASATSIIKGASHLYEQEKVQKLKFIAP